MPPHNRLCKEVLSFFYLPDVLTLSVVTELPPRNDWTRTVNFNPSQQDVQFKKMLIYLSVHFLKTCPYNSWVRARFSLKF